MLDSRLSSVDTFRIIFESTNFYGYFGNREVGNVLFCTVPIIIRTYPSPSGGAEVVGAFRTTLILGPPMENKFQDSDTKTPANVVGYFDFCGFSFSNVIMGILLVKLEYLIGIWGIIGIWGPENLF